MTAAIGVGVMLAGMCGLRMASDDARFACPEVDYGLIGGSAGLLASLGMPEAKVREIVYTRRELEDTGFFNCVVSPPAVLPLALDLADTIATKSLPALRARKLDSLMFAGPEWMEAYSRPRKHPPDWSRTRKVMPPCAPRWARKTQNE